MFVYPSNQLFSRKDFLCIEENKRLFEKKTEQDRLQALAVLCIKSEIALLPDYDLIINKFVECKLQKKNNCSARVGLLLLIVVDCMSIK